MKNKDYPGIVPVHITGTEMEVDACVALPDENGAQLFYQKAKSRLLDVNNWHRIAGYVSAGFQVTDVRGNELDKIAEKGNFIRIDIPGPGSKAGDGYDWVKIEEVREMDSGDVQSIGMRVRPAQNPANDSEDIAHFYDDTATSNFLITREGNKVTAVVVDPNVKPNDDTKSVIDKIRHTVVGLSAIGAFSKVQWQNLADGLVKRDEEEK